MIKFEIMEGIVVGYELKKVVESFVQLVEENLVNLDDVPASERFKMQAIKSMIPIALPPKTEEYKDMDNLVYAIRYISDYFFKRFDGNTYNLPPDLIEEA